MFSGCSIRDEYKPKIKLQEAFSFDSINKQKKTVNAYDIIIEQKISEGVEKLINCREDEFTIEDIRFFMSLPPKSYKTNDSEIRELVRNYEKAIGNGANLNWIDTSNVTDMSRLF